MNRSVQRRTTYRPALQSATVASFHAAVGCVAVFLRVAPRARVMPQPDFHKVFCDYFGQTPKQVRYRLRRGPNARHDLCFLSSLLHDASFRPMDMRLTGKRLTIPLVRDCWELAHQSLPTLVVKSHLSISPVFGVKWQFENAALLRGIDELGIDSIYPGEGYYSRERERFQFLILGSGLEWKCLAEVSTSDFAVALADQEMPHPNTT